MSDIYVKLQAEALGKSLEGMSEAVEKELNAAVENLAHSAFASMKAQIQASAMNPKNRQDYLRGLNFDKVGPNSYLISLEGEWPNKLEEGFDSFDMKQTHLKSSKTVQVGSRAGLPWVQKAKDGHKFAFVPFEHKPFAKDPGYGDLAKDIKKLMGKGIDGHVQNMTKIFKSAEGNPFSGKVAKLNKFQMAGVDVDPRLQGLVKYQHNYDGGATQSIYMTYRVLSERSNGWIHPGYEGKKLFPETEKQIRAQLEDIINKIVK